MHEELKPCPFCGSKNIVVRKYTAVAGVHYYVQCDSANGGCGAEFESRISRKDAIKAWNKRVAEVVHGEWIDKLVECNGVAEIKSVCSLCGNPNKQYKPPYCPHCGAKMDKEQE